MLVALFLAVLAQPSPDLWVRCQQGVRGCGNLQARMTPQGLDLWFDHADVVQVFGTPLAPVVSTVVYGPSPWAFLRTKAGDPLFELSNPWACGQWYCPTMQRLTTFQLQSQDPVTLRFEWVPMTGGSVREFTCTAALRGGDCPWNDKLVSTVPEPATWALLGVGMLGLFTLRRRFR